MPEPHAIIVGQNWLQMECVDWHYSPRPNNATYTVESKPHSSQDRLPADANPFDSLLKRHHEPNPATSSLPATVSTKAKPVEGIVVGNLIGLADDGGFLVQFPGNPSEQPAQALAVVAICEQDVGRAVALSFVAGNIQQPLILGFIRATANEVESISHQTFEIQQDGQRLVISAEQELVLKCGESTITLTKDGKITVRGKQLLSRAEGMNRIKGGAVQIN